MFQTQQNYARSDFLRHHIHLDLKILEKDPRKLWVALKEYYDQHRSIILPEAWREQSLLHLTNFKSIARYNSAMPKICCKLQFCDQIIDNAEIIQKTLSIFFLSNSLLHQQYHRHKYAKYFDLIHDRLQVEKYDALLTKNYQLRPARLSNTIKK